MAKKNKKKDIDFVEVNGVKVFSAQRISQWIFKESQALGCQIDRADIKANVAIALVAVQYLIDLIKALIS